MVNSNDPGMVALLEHYDSPSVSAYREAVKLHLFYADSDFSFRKGKANKEQSKRWRDAAHRILHKAFEKLKESAA